MARGFIPFDLDQRFLLPCDVREWLPEGHLARFILDVVEELDLRELMQAYAKSTDRGRAGYHPKMLLWPDTVWLLHGRTLIAPD